MPRHQKESPVYKVIASIAELIYLYPPNGSNEIVLPLGIYTFSGENIDLTGYTITSTADIVLRGYSQAINSLSSTQANISLITTTGNLFLDNIEFQVSGANSIVIDMNGNTGFESLDMNTVAFINCTQMGDINGIRQGFWVNGFSTGTTLGFKMDGNWVGGFTVRDTRTINADYILSSNTGTFSMGLNASIRGTVNSDVGVGQVVFDFDFADFSANKQYQIDNCKVSGAGKMVSDFTTGAFIGSPEGSPRCFFRDNVGVGAVNTRVGGEWKCTTQVVTPLTVGNAAKLLGTTTPKNMQHLDQAANNRVEFLTDQSFIKIDGQLVIDGGPNDILELEIRRWDDSAGAFVILETYTRRVAQVGGTIDVAIFNIDTTTEGDTDDYIEAWITNTTDNTNVTMLNDSQLFMERR